MATRSPSPEPDSGETEALGLFLQAHEDHLGLLAFALHRQALADFRSHFTSTQGATPDGEALRGFLLGEFTPARVAEYRRRAAQMTGAPAASMEIAAPSPASGVGQGGPVTPEARPALRALILKLALLLAAVIVSALMMRIFVVKP